jgi:phosphoglycerate dehydrogenase-like enzyme
VTDVIVVNEPFERWWSFSADHAAARWAGPDLAFIRVPPGGATALSEIELPRSTRRLLVLSLGLDLGQDLNQLPDLEEVAFSDRPGEELASHFEARGLDVYEVRNEGYWGQSVAEFALGLTLSGLRRIPQTAAQMREDLDAWQYLPDEGKGQPGQRAAQFGDDPRFVSGTVAGKQVRVAGMGNIGSRYASFCNALGADVAGWSPSAPDPVFHRAGARRRHRLPELIADAEIFAPMFPLLPGTEGIISGELIDSLPQGCLVILVTRAQVVDTEALRRRVLADELSLAADVFDIEPLPLNDPLIGRHNVVHTPHNAGRTIDANKAFVDELLDQFRAPNLTTVDLGCNDTPTSSLRIASRL